MIFVLTVLFAGLLAGAVAGFLVEGHGLGIFGDLVIGVSGAFIGGALMPKMAAYYGFWGILLMSILGAILLLTASRIVHYLVRQRRARARA